MSHTLGQFLRILNQHGNLCQSDTGMMLCNKTDTVEHELLSQCDGHFYFSYYTICKDMLMC